MSATSFQDIRTFWQRGQRRRALENFWPQWGHNLFLASRVWGFRLGMDWIRKESRNCAGFLAATN
jgi:hypothetical protein